MYDSRNTKYPVGRAANKKNYEKKQKRIQSTRTDRKRKETEKKTSQKKLKPLNKFWHKFRAIQVQMYVIGIFHF